MLIDEEECLRNLEKMSRKKFESICLELLEIMGFHISDVKSLSGDIVAEGRLEKEDERPLDYIIKCTRSGGDVKVEIESLKKMMTARSHGLLLTTKKIDAEIDDSDIEVAGGDRFYRLLDNFGLLSRVEKKEEKRSGGRLLREGDHCLSEGNYEQALEYYERAIAEENEPALAFLKKGLIFFEKNSLEEAEEAFRDSLDLDPDNPEAWVKLGQIHDGRDEKEKAVELYDKALDYDEDSIEAWKGKGKTLRDLELYDEAVLCFDRMIEIEPKNFKAWNEKGLCHLNKREYKEALDAFNSALTIQPRFEEAMLNKALVFEKLGKIKQALSVAEKLVDSNAKNAEYHYIKGAYLEKLGENKDAWRSIQRALQLDPGHKKAQELQFILQEKLGRGTDTSIVGEARQRITSKEIEEEIKAAVGTEDQGKLSIIPKGGGKFELKIDDKKEEITELKGKKDELEKDLEKREKEITDLADELEDTKRRLKEKEEKEDGEAEASEKVSELMDREEELEGLLSGKKEDIQQLEDEKYELENTVRDLEEQIAKWENIEKEMEKKEKDIDQLVGEREVLKSKLNKKREETKELMDRLETLKKETERKDKKIKELKDKEKYYKGMIEGEEVVGAYMDRNIYGERRGVKEARLLWTMGENSEALEHAPRVDHKRAYNIMGCCFYDLGDMDSAEDMFENARPWLLSDLNLEEMYYNRGRYEDAGSLVEELNQRKGAFEDVLSFLERGSETLRRLERLGSAVELYEKAERLESDPLVDFVMAKARCIVKKEGLSQGIGSLESIGSKEDHLEILNLLGVFYLKDKKYKKSFEIYSKMVEEAKNDHRYLNNLGCSAHHLEKFDEAMNAFEDALGSKPAHRIILNNLGFCQLEMNLVDAALETFKRAVEVNKKDPVSWYNKGIALKRLEDEGWREAVERAVELEPDFEEAKKILNEED